MPDYHDFVCNDPRELLAQMDYGNDSPTNSAPPPPEPEDSALRHDVDDRRQARRAIDLAMRFLHRGSRSIDQARGVGQQQTKRIGLDDTLGCDQVDRTRPAEVR